MELQQTGTTENLSRRQRYSAELLRLSTLELEAYVRELAQENPVIELEESRSPLRTPDRAALLGQQSWLEENDHQNWFFQRLSDEELDPLLWADTGGGLEETLISFLSRQLNRLRPEKELRRLTEYLIHCLEDDGYLRVPLKELGVPLDRLEQALTLLQSLEPAGVGAANLSQCLELQLKRIGESGPALDIVRNYLDLLARRRYGEIAQALGITEEQVERARRVIQELEPRPGAVFQRPEQVHYPQPDWIVELREGRLAVNPVRGARPLFRISPYYKELLARSEDWEVRAYLAEKLEQAEDVLWAAERREAVLLRCVQLVTERRAAFFQGGDGFPEPLDTDEAALAAGLQAFEIRQAAREKYIQCARGVFPLSRFFSQSVPAE